VGWRRRMRMNVKTTKMMRILMRRREEA